MARAVDEALRRAGRLDVVVNDAGVDTLGAIEDIALDKVREIMETNFLGALRVTRRALSAMRTQGAGKIVMVTSVAAVFSSYGEGAYAASKRALEGAAKVLQNEAARWGIRVLVANGGSRMSECPTSPRDLTEWRSSDAEACLDTSYPPEVRRF